MKVRVALLALVSFVVLSFAVSDVGHAVDGGSISFNGTNQYLSLPGSNDWAVGTGDFTVEWFQYQTDFSSSWPRIFSVGSYPSTSIGVSIEGGTFYVWLASGYRLFASTGSISNRWVHFAVARSGTTLRIFKNGVQLASGTDSTNVTNSSTALYIGSEATSGTYFGGLITNFHFVKGTALYTSAFTPSGPLSAVANSKLLLQAVSSGSLLSDSSSVARTVNGVNIPVFNWGTPFPWTGNVTPTSSPATAPPATTVAPTTVPATTVAPTTVPATTVAPTTVPATTAAPTTVPATTTSTPITMTTIPPATTTTTLGSTTTTISTLSGSTGGGQSTVGTTPNSATTTTSAESKVVVTTTTIPRQISALVTSTTLVPPSTTTTSTTTSTSTTIPAPIAPAVVSGEAAAYLGGKEIDVDVRRVSNELVLTFGVAKVVIGSVDSKDEKKVLSGTGVLELTPGGSLSIRAEGVRPLAKGEFWLFSDPTQLGTATANDAGRLSAKVQVPSKIELGNHRFVVSAKDTQGNNFELAVGLEIRETQSSNLRWRFILALVILFGGALLALFMPSVLRRRRA
ncbi:MAG: LamG domain-containing protein [Ilumatobacteraceae bacterium]